MSESTTPDPAVRRPRPITRGTRIGLIISIALMILGGGLWMVALAAGPGETGGSTASPAATAGEDDGSGGAGPAGGSALQPRGLAPVIPPGSTPEGDDSAADDGAVPGDGDDVPAADADPGPLETWSPTIFRLGFSFFVGFAIAFAVRSFLKVAVLIAGVILIVLFALQYFGAIDVNWALMESWFTNAGGWVKAQASSVQEFVTGYLPSGASALAGLTMGFRRGR